MKTYKELMAEGGGHKGPLPSQPNANPHTVAATIKGVKGQGAKLNPGIKLNPAAHGHSGRFNI